MRSTLIVLLTSVALVIGLFSLIRAQIPQTMSYQGVLTDGAGGAVSDGSYDITFKVYTGSSGGTEIWTETQTVSVSGGIFSVVLGSQTPLAIAFDVPYWLGVSVDGGPELAPRRELTSAAYSLNARDVADSAVTSEKIKSGEVVRSLNSLTDDVTLAAGTNVAITTSGDSIIVSSSGGGSSLDWSLTGNAGTTAGTNFMGTTDNQALDLRVNNTRTLRLEPNATSPNIVTGHSSNTVDSGVHGAVVSGGGVSTGRNRITDHYGVIGGGAGNQTGNSNLDYADADFAVVGGGENNTATAHYATVAGGDGNDATNTWATIGGGSSNSAIGAWATIAGGQLNYATGRGAVGGGQENRAEDTYTTVSGGYFNRATGYGSTVIGGLNNWAGGDRSIAGGTRAKVSTVHNGVIMLTDDNAFDFSSVAPREFAVRSTGGVRLVTGVDGTGAPNAGATLAAGSGTWGSLSDRDAKENFERVDSDDILASVANLEISTWNYKAQDESIRHIGPIAQDFYAAFGVGGDDKRITTVDADGVSLAAIQALNKKLNQEVTKKNAQISDLQKRIEHLESLVLRISQADKDTGE